MVKLGNFESTKNSMDPVLNETEIYPLEEVRLAVKNTLIVLLALIEWFRF
jgi:hypothetical protein